MNDTQQVAPIMTVLVERITPERTPRQQWNAGWQSFVRRESYALMATDHERSGYLAALNACAYASGNAYLVKIGGER